MFKKRTCCLLQNHSVGYVLFYTLTETDATKANRKEHNAQADAPGQQAVHSRTAVRLSCVVCHISAHEIPLRCDLEGYVHQLILKIHL